MFYASGNRAGKLLAQRLRGHRYKSKIPFIIHPATKTRHYHPKDIADAFNSYYVSLYNLGKDPLTPQPDPEMITKFLADLQLPRLNLAQLQELNAPFSLLEVHSAINSIPPNKSPLPRWFCW